MKLTFHPDLIVRTPFFPLENLFNTTLDEILANSYFREALYIASPELAAEVFNATEDLSDPLKLVVLKYFNRMCFRCTPYGLFAGCGKIKWGTTSRITRNHKQINRRSRLDKEYIIKLLKSLGIERELLFQLNLSLNNTLYQVGDHIRMIEACENGDTFQITAFEQNELMKVLLNDFRECTFIAKDLLHRSNDLGLKKKSIKDYLIVLFEDGIIKTELDISLPASELLQHYIAVISSIREGRLKSNWNSLLQGLQVQLSDLDQVKLVGYEKYESLLKNASSCLPGYPVKKIIQVDYTYPPKTASLNSSLKKSLLKAIEILCAIRPSKNHEDSLNRFKIAFEERYEKKEIPLLLALDPEIGIDYTQQNSFDSFLINDLGYHRKIRQRNLYNNDPIHQYLIESFHNAVAIQSLEIKLDETKLIRPGDPKISLPKSSSVFFRLTGKDQIQIKSVGGSSGVNLFSRFTDFDQNLKELARQIADIEQKDSEMILAEVIHEPFARSGNIMPGYDIRKFQIPYLSQGNQNGMVTIALSDIYVLVKQGQIS